MGHVQVRKLLRSFHLFITININHHENHHENHYEPLILIVYYQPMVGILTINH